MDSSKQTSVAVIYNFRGEDEYEVLRKKVQNGEVVSPTGNIKDLERIATVQEEVDALVVALQIISISFYTMLAERSLGYEFRLLPAWKII